MASVAGSEEEGAAGEEEEAPEAAAAGRSGGWARAGPRRGGSTRPRSAPQRRGGRAPHGPAARARRARSHRGSGPRRRRGRRGRARSAPERAHGLARRRDHGLESLRREQPSDVEGGVRRDDERAGRRGDAHERPPHRGRRARGRARARVEHQGHLVEARRQREPRERELRRSRGDATPFALRAVHEQRDLRPVEDVAQRDAHVERAPNEVGDLEVVDGRRRGRGRRRRRHQRAADGEARVRQLPRRRGHACERRVAVGGEHDRAGRLRAEGEPRRGERVRERPVAAHGAGPG